MTFLLLFAIAFAPFRNENVVDFVSQKVLPMHRFDSKEEAFQDTEQENI